MEGVTLFKQGRTEVELELHPSEVTPAIGGIEVEE
jgi:hypothetical protein